MKLTGSHVAILFSLLLNTALTRAFPDPFGSFETALDLLGTFLQESLTSDDNSTTTLPVTSPSIPEPTALLDRRQQVLSNCPTSYNNCGNLGASGLCCAHTAVCSADYAAHVACCPLGAACTGTIASVITGGTIGGTTTTSNGGLLGGAITTTTTAAQLGTSNGLVIATTTVGSAGTTDDGQSFLIGGTAIATAGAVVGKRIPEVVS